jgi:hypothetical protein
VCPWVQVIVSAMTSPTPSYGDDVAGGGSPARLTHTGSSMRSRANAARVLRMVSAAMTLPHGDRLGRCGRTTPRISPLACRPLPAAACR